MVVFNWPKGHQTTNEKFNPDNKILMLIVNSFFFVTMVVKLLCVIHILRVY